MASLLSFALHYLLSQFKAGEIEIEIEEEEGEGDEAATQTPLM